MDNLNDILDLSSKSTVSFICKLIFDYENRFKKPGDDEKLKFIDDLNLESNQGLEGSILYINVSLNNLFKSSEKDDFYFFDCSLGLYDKLYSIRLKRFLTDHRDSIELDFLEYELDVFNNPNKNRVLTCDYNNFNYSKYLIKNVDFKIALNRKIEFIEQCINEVKNKKQFNSNIFRSMDSQNWFNNTLFELNAIDKSNKPLRGFPAKCSAIFSNKKCKNYIFKYYLSITEYINYLNNNFKAQIKSKNKLSAGNKHEYEVYRLIKTYIKSLSPNEPE
jgi:hypothetical protein